MSAESLPSPRHCALASPSPSASLSPAPLLFPMMLQASDSSARCWRSRRAALLSGWTSVCASPPASTVTSTAAGRGGTASCGERRPQSDRANVSAGSNRWAEPPEWSHSPQQADFELQGAEDLADAVRVRQQVAGVWDLGGVDLRVVLLHTRQAKHVTGFQQVGLRPETLSTPPTWTNEDYRWKQDERRSTSTTQEPTESQQVSENGFSLSCGARVVEASHTHWGTNTHKSHVLLQPVRKGYNTNTHFDFHLNTESYPTTTRQGVEELFQAFAVTYKMQALSFILHQLSNNPPLPAFFHRLGTAVSAHSVNPTCGLSAVVADVVVWDVVLV